MKSTDVTIIAAPFGFGPTGKALAISRELVKRGYSVKILGDENTLRLVRDAGLLAYKYEYRTEINLANLKSRLVISYLDISTKILNYSGIPLIFADSLFWLRGRFERSYGYPADMVLSQKFFMDPLETECKKANNFHEVGAILSPGFIGDLPSKTKKLVFYPGGLRSPYLGDEYGKSYYGWCKNVLFAAVRRVKGWSCNDLVFILPPQLNDNKILKELDAMGVKYVINCSDTSKHLMTATHAFISPGIETTLESLAAGIMPIFTPAFNGSHIPQLMADRFAKIGKELSGIFNEGTKKFEGGTNHLSGLSVEVEKYTMKMLTNDKVFTEAVNSMIGYLNDTPTVDNRFPLGKDGASDIVNYAEVYLRHNHIPSPYYRVSAKAKIIMGNKIILVKEDGKKLDLPGGGVEHSEKIMEALRRELGEEIGYKGQISVNTLPRLFKMMDESSGRPLLFVVYEISLKEGVNLTSGKNTHIKLLSRENISEEDLVSYNDDYTKYILS